MNIKLSLEENILYSILTMKFLVKDYIKAVISNDIAQTKELKSRIKIQQEELKNLELSWVEKYEAV